MVVHPVFYKSVMKKTMNKERYRGLQKIMMWYNEDGNDKLLSEDDYLFLYNIWNHDIEIYGTKIKDRLNKIRETFLKHYTE